MKILNFKRSLITRLLLQMKKTGCRITAGLYFYCGVTYF